MRMLPVLAVLVATSASADAPWIAKTREDGITVYNRPREGSPITELKAVGMIEAPPKAVWAVIRDYEHYKDNMPYTEESRIVGREDGDKVLYVYSSVNAPFVSKRDYVIRIVDESDWKDGQGFLKSSWTMSDKGPPPKTDVVRVPHNDGFWLLEPREGGKKTFATYWLFTDPGGSIPTWIANMANSNAVPDVFRAIRRKASESPYKDAK